MRKSLDATVDGLRELYGRARELVQFKQFDEAQRLYDVLRPSVTEPHLKALLLNDVVVLQAVRGNLDDAVQTFTEAVAADPSYQSARENLALLQADLTRARAKVEDLVIAAQRIQRNGPANHVVRSAAGLSPACLAR